MPWNARHTLIAAFAIVLLSCSPDPKPSAPPTAHDAKASAVVTPGWTRPDCSTIHAPRPERDPRPMCWVPAGEFTMGAPDEEQNQPRRVRITSGFYIDQHEVTAEVFARFLNDSRNVCPEDANGVCANLTANGYVFEGKVPPISPQRGLEDHPMSVVTHAGARAFCAWAGKRLPSEAQWEFAARHDPLTGKDRLYPWGDTWRSKLANCSDDDCEDGEIHEMRVGSFPEGASATGALDMSGNADEWVLDCFHSNPTCEGTCVDPVVTEECEPTCLQVATPSHPVDPTRCPSVGVKRGGNVTAARQELRTVSRGIADFFVGSGMRCVHVASGSVTSPP